MQSAPDYSLLDILKSTGFESATFSTFSVNLPFFEDVVVPRLRAARCRHINLLVDDKQLRLQMMEPATAARLAGRFYTLIPIRSEAAFHPKIIFLAGKNKGLVHVGSHNATIAGLSHNRELTAFLAVSPSNGPSVAIATSIWKSILDWASQSKNTIPKSVLDALGATRSFAPWLGSVDQEKSERVQVFSQLRSGPSLWSQIQRILPEKAIRVSVLGAFFDAKLTFLGLVREKYPRAPIAVGIDPTSVQLVSTGAAARAFSWHNLSKFHNDHYLHAKALYIEAKDTAVLLVGSANPSAPAWVGRPDDVKNDECIISFSGPEAKKAATLLQLDVIDSFPKIPQSLLDEVAARSRVEIANEERDAAIAPEVIVCSVDANALAVLPGVKAKNLLRIDGLSEDGSARWGKTGGWSESEGELSVQLSQEEADVIWLKFSFRGGRIANGLIHRTTEMGALSRTGKEKALRDALDGLHGQSTDLASLIALVEKAIFEEPVGAVRQQHDGTPSKRGEQMQPGKPRPESLIVDLEDIRRKKAYGRLIGSGESSLSDLLAALIYAMRLPGPANGLLDSHGRTEEEISGQDDENVQPIVDDHEIAKLCRSKVRRLVRRTADYLESASNSISPRNWRDGLLKITAVLAILRELKSVELNERWLSAREIFVTDDAFSDLYEGIVGPLFGRKHGLIRRLIQHLDYDRFDELARLKGLLIWLAWECEATPLSKISAMDDDDERWDKLFDRAVFVAISQLLPQDKVALDEVTRSLDLCTRLSYRGRANSWYEQVGMWIHGIERISLLEPKMERVSVVGCLALVTSDAQKELRVVTDASDAFVSVVDLGAEDRKARYQRDKVVAIPFH